MRTWTGTSCTVIPACDKGGPCRTVCGQNRFVGMAGVRPDLLLGSLCAPPAHDTCGVWRNRSCLVSVQWTLCDLCDLRILFWIQMCFQGPALCPLQEGTDSACVFQIFSYFNSTLLGLLCGRHCARTVDIEMNKKVPSPPPSHIQLGETEMLKHKMSP